MVKKIAATFICIFIIFSLPLNHFTAENKEPEYKRVHDTLLTTLNPYIGQAVIKYYGESKQYGLYDAKILNIERPHEGGFTFKVKVQVTTFEHAHSPPYGIETVTMEVDSSGIEVTDFQHRGDKWEQKIKTFYRKVLQDIKQSHGLTLEGYKKYTYGQVMYRTEKEDSFQSLANIIKDIKEMILNPEIHPPNKNVIDPITFIKGDQGYILFKKTDGTNIVYRIKKENDQWMVTQKSRKPGKKMDDVLLWYM
jgi:hypothetical protein